MGAETKVVPGDDGPKAEAVPGGLNIKPKGKFFIDPNSPRQQKWDYFIIILLLFTAAVTPAEVAFLGEPKINFLFFVNRIVDCGFIIDMCFQFFLGFTDPETNEIIYHRGRIFINYTTGWFPIDLVSVIPFDMLGMVMQSDDVSQLKVLRTVRLLRLIKLLRVLRSARIFARLEHSLGWSYVSLSLMRYFTAAFVNMHWMACLWAIIPQMSDNYPSWIDESGLADASASEMYISSFEFALMAMVVGYGAFEPANNTERSWAILILLVAGSLYAYLIGAICNAVASKDPATTKCHQTMDLLNMYMEEIKLPKLSRVKMREFVANCTQMQRQEFYQEVLEGLSPALRGEIADRTAGPWIRKVPFFVCEDLDEQNRFVINVAMVLKRGAFTRSEMLFKEGEIADRMYIVQQGVVGAQGRVLRSGSYTGEDMIMQSGRRIYRATAMTFVDMQVLEKQALTDVLDEGDFPETERLIQTAAFRMALRNYFRSIVNTLKAANMMGRKGGSMTEQEIADWKQSMADALAANKTAAPGKGRRSHSYDAKEEESSAVDVETLLKPKQAKQKASIKTCQSKVEQLMSDVMDLTRALRGGTIPSADSKTTVASLSDGLKGKMGDHGQRLSVLEDVQRENTKLLHKLLQAMKVDGK